MKPESDLSALAGVAYALGAGALALLDLWLVLIIGPSFCENREGYTYCDDLSDGGRFWLTLIPAAVLVAALVAGSRSRLAGSVGLTINAALVLVAANYFLGS